MSVENHKNLSKKKILLAEDDDSMRRFVEVILQKANYDVIATKDGLAAMKAALENEIDAVVADAVMSNMTGYDLCRCCAKTRIKNTFHLSS
ncbi:MAG: response regulator [Acidobacteriota bacterium]